MLDKIKKFFQTPIGKHVHSFIKTYVTVFVGTYLALNGMLDEINIKVIAAGLQDVNLTDINIVMASSKFAFISVIRNLYKLLTE